MKTLYYTLFFVLAAFNLSAQCPLGEVEVTIEIETDQYGYEGYWQLVPDGNSCGSGTIASGGNTQVGCSGGGDQNQDPGGYGDNLTINAGPWCLTENAQFTIHYIDDWGDGGFYFNVYVNGYFINEFTGLGANHLFNFIAAEPPAYDVGVTSILTPNYTAAGNVTLDGMLWNYGTTTITSVDLNYQIDSDPVVTQNISGLNIPHNTGYHYYHPVDWNASNGIYTVSVWASNLNGNADLNTSNDVATKEIEVGPGIPNVIDYYIGAPTLVTTIGDISDGINDPTDLDFHPTLTKKELWVVNRGIESTGGSTVKFSDAGESNQTSLWQQDDNAYHFMSLVTGIAFSENENFATSPGVYDANHDGGAPFTGPALWSSDPAIYAQNWGGLGSHIDMLHESPYSQGIASDDDNVFWLFDGNNDDIVRYDFQQDHGPGNDYHGDGIIWRYAEEEVAKDPSNIIVSHLVLHKESGWLYVVDNGNQRVIRINTNTGTIGGNPSAAQYESLQQYVEIDGYTWETVVDADLQDPAGIDVIGDRMIVSDYSTGDILIYDISVIPALFLGQVSTGDAGVQGIKIGYDGKIWFVNGLTDEVGRLELPPVNVIEPPALSPAVYPNPVIDGMISIRTYSTAPCQLTILNELGQQVFYQGTVTDNMKLQLDLTAGVYFVKLESTGSVNVAMKKLIVQ